MYQPTYTTLSPFKAIILMVVVTTASLFGLAMGKKLDKVHVHVDVPSRRRYAHLSLND